MPSVSRTIRVFVSSTFEDLRPERDVLQRDVFPHLSQLCQDRGFRFQPVDLRWGVRREAALDQRTMEVCLREIDRCKRTGLKPNFVVLLGSRYGWQPLPSHIASEEFGRLHSVLADPADRKFLAGWYRRDDNAEGGEWVLGARSGGYIADGSWATVETRLREILQTAADRAQLPAAAAQKFHASATHQEIEHGLSGGAANAEHVYAFCRLGGDSEEPALMELKQRIKATLGNHAADYPAGDLNAFRASALQILTRAIETQLAGSTPASDLETEILAHDAFARERGMHFVGRADVLETISAHAAGVSRRPLAVLGAPGSGKSAVMAHGSALAMNAHRNAVVLRRFIGATPGSSNGASLLHSLCAEIARRYGVDLTVPFELNSLLQTFIDALRLASTERPLILFIDALDQLEPADPVRSLAWVPSQLPAECRIVISSNDAGIVGSRADRVDVGSLPDSDAEVLLSAWLREAGRRLTPGQRSIVLEAFSTSPLPLLLRLAFEEARRWRSFDQLDECRLAGTVDEVVEVLLDRLSADSNHGRVLVDHSLAYLAAARHGLTEDEMVALLSTDEVVWDDFERRAHHDPPERKLPVVIWSRLRADLEPYLAERETRDGLMLGFYHRQVRDALTRRFDAENARQAHQHIAGFFRLGGDSEGNDSWSGAGSRARRELPFHLAHSENQPSLAKLLQTLSYLNARVANGEAFGVAADFRLLSTTTAVSPWEGFLRRHAQRLTEYPDILVSLVCHEGFEEARAQAVGRQWPFPWLRTWPESRPDAAAPSPGLSCKIEATNETPGARVKAFASQRQIVFSLERIGTVGMLTAEGLEPLVPRLTIRHERPRAFCAAPAATSLVVCFESGVADLYRLALDESGVPVTATREKSFAYLVPEIDAPVCEWLDGHYWFQVRPDCLARVNADNGVVTDELLPNGCSGELAALVALESGHRIIALRSGLRVSLLDSIRELAHFDKTDVCSACSCGDGIALALSDGRIVVWRPDSTAVSIRTEIPRGSILWDGEQLLWATVDGLRAWRPNSNAPSTVQDDNRLFPTGLHVVPTACTRTPSGATLLLTSHSVAVFHINEGGTTRTSRLERIFGGPIWRAVRMHDDTQVLWQKNSEREVQITTTASRLYGAPDGRGFLYALEVEGRGAIWNLTTMESRRVRNAPVALYVSKGDPETGCWFTDRLGGIFHVDREGVSRRLASIGHKNHGGTLDVCGEHLIWRGFSPRYYDDAGVDQARLFIAFRRIVAPEPRLDRIGERWFAVKEGLPIDLQFAATSGMLHILWHIENAPAVLRIASVSDFLEGRWVDHALPADEIGTATSALSPCEEVLAILTFDGGLIFVGAGDGRMIARLSGSAKFTHIAPGGEPRSFWIVEERDRVFGCTVQFEA